jgi:hypothetical protein
MGREEDSPAPPPHPSAEENRVATDGHDAPPAVTSPSTSAHLASPPQPAELPQPAPSLPALLPHQLAPLLSALLRQSAPPQRKQANCITKRPVPVAELRY